METQNISSDHFDGGHDNEIPGNLNHVDSNGSKNSSSKLEGKEVAKLAPDHGQSDTKSRTSSSSRTRRTSKRNSRSSNISSGLQASSTSNHKQHDGNGVARAATTAAVAVGTPDRPHHSINAYATMLSRLDQRGYKRALMKDADRLVENILQPMSLPWGHISTSSARNIPCDIDNMIDVLTVDEGEFSPFDSHSGGNFGYGQYENGRFRTGKGSSILAHSSDLVRSATRRSVEPGVIEFSSIELPIYSLQEPTSRKDVIDVSATTWKDQSSASGNGRTNEDGEIELRCFEVMQGIKKRKVDKTRSKIQRLDISVRVDSCSSRPTVLDVGQQPSQTNNQALPHHLLEAVLPMEAQNGRYMTKKQARDVAKNLGTYDVNNELEANKDTSQQNTTRPKAGRTRLLWVDRSISRQSKGAMYSSILTGEILDKDQHKRPRAMKVQIRVGGNVFPGPPETKMEDAQSVTDNYLSPNLQSTLDVSKYTECLLSESEGSNGTVLPATECIPDSCGTIHVSCTSPGQIPIMDVDTVLTGATSDGEGRHRCSVCFQSSDGGLTVEECSRCGLFAHPECCLDKGKRRISTNETSTGSPTSNEWVCACCCYKDIESGIDPESNHYQKRSKRSPKPSNKLLESEWKPSSMNQSSKYTCTICNHLGGAMSEVCIDGTNVWVHEVCRIWTCGGLCRVDKTASSSNQNRCILCSKSDDPNYGCCTVKCAASNCHVHVHPMCALLSSASSFGAESMTNNDVSIIQNGTNVFSHVDMARQNDKDRCKQYALSFVGVTTAEKVFGQTVTPVSAGGTSHSARQNHTTMADQMKKESSTSPIMIPVVFCGMHNPKRDQSFYGLPPGGFPDDTLRVPPCIDP
mmetsp:Transcript_58163/g.142201  ORF Transcript_58163/g.142201 Transcript_58163/m.142201 type:complete len:860 (+) Transcript_58163:197-2776(+)